MIKGNFIVVVSAIIILAIVTIISSYNTITVNADNDFCYDQVGEGNHCFEKEKRCDKAQRHDEIAESPCYNKDD